MKAFLKNKKALLSLGLIICVIASIFAVTAMPAGAAEDTVDYGASFAADKYYAMESAIGSEGAITFEAEISIPASQKASRNGVIIGNYDDNAAADRATGAAQSRSLGLELHYRNSMVKVRLHTRHVGEVYFDYDLNNDLFDSQGNPIYAKISVVADTSTGTFTLYVNGEQKAQATSTKLTAGCFANLEPMYVGSDPRKPAGSQYFKGSIKNVSVYSDVRTAEEIAAYANAETFTADSTDPNLLCAYDLTDLKVNGGYLNDYSANAIKAVDPNWTLGSEGRSFTSSDNLLLSKDLTEMPNTFEAVVYAPTSIGRIGVIFGNYHLSEACLNFELHDSGKATVYLDPDTASSPYSTKIADVRTDDGWVHIAIVRNLNTETGSTYDLYVDGKYVTSTTLAKDKSDLDMTEVQKTYKFQLGGDSRSDNVRYFQGKIKNVALYSEALTAEEVKNSYKNGVGTVDGGLILNYDMTTLESNSFVRDLSGNGHHMTRDGASFDAYTEGREFTAEDALYLQNKLTEMPMTYEATIFVPMQSRPGVIFGNYSAGSSSCVNFEIYSSCKPSVYILDDEGNLMQTKFNYNLTQGEWAHVVITHELLAAGGARFTCYVDGEQVATFDTALSYKFTPEIVQDEFPLSLGHDSRSGNEQYYKGRIKNVALYSDVLTAEEIKASYENGIDTSNESIMLYYDLTKEENKEGTVVTDATGNGYDLGTERYMPFYERKAEISSDDYDYAFAIVGDTQKLVYRDYLQGTNYTSYIYDWIVANKDSKKIELVMGLGDITDKNYDAEWAIAKEQIQKLGAANMFYSLVPGNHDGPDTYTKYNSYFSSEESLTKNISGYYNDDNTQVANYYMKRTIGEDKYMIFCLQYGARDEILEWAGEIIDAEENADYKVIITTHCYLYRDGTTLDAGDVAPPNSSSSTSDDTRNNGDMLWEEFVSQHKNIVLVLSGHDPCSDIVMRQDIGVNGNVVTQFLVDPQGMDISYAYETGMVAMFYFMKDGSTKVEFISTYQTAEARKEDPGSDDYLFKLRNQFEFTLEDYPEELETEYGYIPYEYRSAEKYPFAVFDGNKNLLGVHANLLDITSLYNNAGALHIAKNYLAKNNYWDGEGYGDSPATAYIVMRRDYTMADTEQYDNIAQVQGLLTIDLGGHTLTASQERTLFPAVSKGWSSGDADNFHSTQFKFTNGSIVAYNKPIVTYSCSCAELKTFDIAFEDIDFKACGTAQSFIMDYASSGQTSYPNISFKGCTFDITESKADSVILFNLGKSLMQANLTVSGGSVIAGDTALTLFLKPDDVNGTLTFSVGDNGKYLVINTNSGAAPEGTFNDGALEFVKVAENTYTLGTAGLSSFTPKMSITLGSELVYNIYVPAIDILKSYTIDGATVEDAKLVTVDGIEYYLIKVSLPAKEAARNIVLKATVTLSDKDYTGTWTVSIPKYAKKVIDMGATEVEADLVRNVLSYIRAAYAYFDQTDEEQIAKIDAILGDDYDASNAPALSGSAEAPSTGLKSVTYILNATPTVRFRITGEADSYAFYVNGNKLKTVVGTDADGTYIDMDVYAYAMAETITYTIDGENAGSYHINSYYTFVSTDAAYKDDAELINLVARFAKYCESAAEYRKFIRGDYGTMTLTAPSEVYSNYPAKDLSVTFGTPGDYGVVTYTTDNANVFVENGKIYATGTFASEVTVTVTAKTRYHIATATVKVSTYNGGISAEKKIQYYEENIIKEENKGGMIFVGDSYVDGYKMDAPPFWRDFYRDFEGEKAFLMGLSSSQIHQLEIASERIVYPMEPSEIVVNIGHNDLHHGTLTVDEFVERLTALFYEYHERLPEAKIYFFSVAPKKIAETNEDRFVSSFEKAPAANAAIKTLAEQHDWLYYVDTTNIFYSYGENLVNTNMFPGNDASHPSLASYDLMKIALDEARGVTRSDVTHIVDKQLTAIRYKDKDGNDITGDFAASGKLVITQYVPGANVYVHFRMHQNYRFVLWDSNGDGKHGAGYLGGGTVKDTTTGVTLYDGTEGLVLNWAVITKTEDDIHKAYWYINGQLMHTFESYTPAYFLIGGENATTTVYDVELSVKSNDEAAYNAHVARYADDVINLETYGYGPLTNKVLTDEDGSTLTDNYIVKGKLNITDFPKDNTYIQFVIGSGNRFLLWDSNNDSKLGAGYTENGTHVNDTGTGIKLYDAKNGLTLDWAVVVNGDTASFYLDGELIKELTVSSSGTYKRGEFKIGASQMNVMLSDIEIYTQASDEDAYNDALSEYIG